MSQTSVISSPPIETGDKSKSALRILITLQYYLPHRTGYTLHVQPVAEALAARGHEVTVLTARHKLDLPRDETVNGVRIVRLWAPLRVSRGMVMPAYPYALWRFLRNFDVVWVHTPMLETALIAFTARLRRRGGLATHHGDLVLPSGWKNRFIEWFVFRLYAFMVKRIHRVTGYSQDYADNSYYLRPFMDKVAIVHPPVLVPEPEPARVKELRKLWQRDDGPVIGYAGRFVKEKRPDLLIRALEVINATYPSARIIFAGEYDIAYEDTWEENQALVNQYKDQLVFLGVISSPQAMANFYAACDLLVLPSDTECMGLVQPEAMMCGTPVVATDIPGGRFPVRQTGMGKTVPPGDWKALGEGIVDVLQHPKTYHRTREQIESVFNFIHTVDLYEQYLREAAETARRRGK